MTGGREKSGVVVSEEDAASYRSDGAVRIRGALDKVWIKLIQKVS